jgi:hypothetical protein
VCAVPDCANDTRAIDQKVSRQTHGVQDSAHGSLDSEHPAPSTVQVGHDGKRQIGLVRHHGFALEWKNATV